MPIAGKRMGLEIIMFREISYIYKDKYMILSYEESRFKHKVHERKRGLSMGSKKREGVREGHCIC